MGFHPNIYLCVNTQAFEEQLNFLRKRLKPAALSSIVQHVEASDHVSNHLVGVSFDDGYRDNLEYALPLLEKYEVPATIFVTTGFIGGTANIWWEELGFIVTHAREIYFQHDDREYRYKLSDDQERERAYLDLNRLFKRLSARSQEDLLKILRPQAPVRFPREELMLNWDQIKALSKHPLISIGAHTVNYPILSNELELAAKDEMSESQKQLKAQLGLDSNLFAYPVGGPQEAGDREFRIAQECQFKAAFTTRNGHIFKSHKDCLQALPRITLDYFDSIEAFAWKTSGFSSLIQRSL